MGFLGTRTHHEVSWGPGLISFHSRARVSISSWIPCPYENFWCYASNCLSCWIIGVNGSFYVPNVKSTNRCSASSTLPLTGQPVVPRPSRLLKSTRRVRSLCTSPCQSSSPFAQSGDPPIESEHSLLVVPWTKAVESNPVPVVPYESVVSSSSSPLAYARARRSSRSFKSIPGCWLSSYSYLLPMNFNPRRQEEWNPRCLKEPGKKHALNELGYFRVRLF